MADKIQTNRSEFYKDRVSLQLIIIGLMIFVFVVMSCALYRALVLRPGTVYFKTDDATSVFVDVSLADPLELKKRDINYWASQTVAALFNVNYINVVNQIESKSDMFDELGWERFKQLLVDQKLLEPIVNQRQVMHGTPSGVPVLDKNGVMGGRYTWQVVVPIEVSYSGRGRYPSKGGLTLAVEVVRSAINEESPEGIVIHNIQLVSERGKNA